MSDVEMTVGVKVILDHPDAFLKIKESLTRIGVANNKDRTLFQSCHILHKKGNYYITHFKELFILDGKPSTIDLDDYKRRNLIVGLLEDWGLLKISKPEQAIDRAPVNSVKILPHGEKSKWNLVAKYSIGVKIKK
jgi:hypothetical protein